MNITKGKIKKILKKSNKKQTNKIKKKVHFRKKKINNRSLKKRNNKVNLRVKTLKYGGKKNETVKNEIVKNEIVSPLMEEMMNQINLYDLKANKGTLVEQFEDAKKKINEGKKKELIDEVEKELKGRATIAKLDIDHSSAIAAKFQVTSVPTLILFNDGKEVDRMVGVRDAEAIKSFITKAN